MQFKHIYIIVCMEYLSSRMGGMPGPMKDEKGRPTRKALALRKWNC